MAIALKRNWIFATDDSAARRFAQQQGIRLTGTLGILIKATSQKMLSLPDADELHSRMLDQGYHSPLSYENSISNYLKS